VRKGSIERADGPLFGTEEKDMNRQQIAKAIRIAKSDADLSGENIDSMMGCTLEGFEPVYVTARQVASHIRYQAHYLMGGWDEFEIQEVARIAKTKFIYVREECGPDPIIASVVDGNLLCLSTEAKTLRIELPDGHTALKVLEALLASPDVKGHALR
jgi:hypothetical protein